MELIRGLHNIRPRHRGCVATIGAFDGVHRGHRAVLQQLVDKSHELGLPSLVIVLEPLPREYFSPLDAPARLTSFRERYEAMRHCGIDRMLRIRFTDKLSQMSAEECIEQIYVRALGIRYFVVGDDLRFGHDREGDFNLLRRAGREQGFEVEDTRSCELQGERVSSTRIRQALLNSDFSLAEKLLGRPYSISGKVVVGQQLGRTLGIPTANVQLHRLRAAMSGVYAVEVSGVDGRILHGVANVGTRPTVDDSITAILEVHLLNFDEDIYGRYITVTFKHKIREEKKFASLQELEAAIRADIDYGRHYFSQP